MKDSILLKKKASKFLSAWRRSTGSINVAGIVEGAAKLKAGASRCHVAARHDHGGVDDVIRHRCHTSPGPCVESPNVDSSNTMLHNEPLHYSNATRCPPSTTATNKRPIYQVRPLASPGDPIPLDREPRVVARPLQGRPRRSP